MSTETIHFCLVNNIFEFLSGGKKTYKRFRNEHVNVVEISFVVRKIDNRLSITRFLCSTNQRRHNHVLAKKFTCTKKQSSIVSRTQYIVDHMIISNSDVGKKTYSFLDQYRDFSQHRVVQVEFDGTQNFDLILG